MLALLGPVGFVRRFVSKFAIWAVLASVVYLAWWIVDGANLGSMWTEGGHHGSFWIAVDTVVAVTVSWAPLVADYTRFSRDRRSAFFGVGHRLPAADAVPVRLRLDPRAVARRRPEPPRADPHRDRRRRRRGRARAARADGGRDGRGVRQRVLGRRVDAEPVAARVAARADRRRLGVATAGALAIDMRSYQRFLLLLGAVFVPLLGRADRGLAARRRALHARRTCSAAPAVRPGPIAAWVGGLPRLRVALPAGRSRLLVAVARRSLPTPSYQIGASMPSLRRRLPADGDCREVRLGACRSSRSSGTSRGTVVDGGPPRIGGAPYYAARAWRRSARARRSFTRCGPEEREDYARRLGAVGLPVVLLPGEETTSFSFSLRRRQADDERRAPGRLVDAARTRSPCRAARGCTSHRCCARTSRPRRSPRSRTAGASRSTGRGSCARAQDRAVAARRGLRSSRARARADPQARGGGGSGRRQRRRARRAGGTGHIRRTRLVRVLRRDARPTSARGRSPPIRPAPATPSRPRTSQAGPGSGPGCGGQTGDGPRGRAADGKHGVVKAAVRTASGVYVVDLETEEVLGGGDGLRAARVSAVELPRVVAAAAAGATRRRRRRPAPAARDLERRRPHVARSGRRPAARVRRRDRRRQPRP